MSGVGPKRGWRRGVRVVWLLMLCTMCASVQAVAQTQNLYLAWESNPEPDIAGYRAYVGTSSRSYDVAAEWVPASQTTYTFPATPGIRYFFAVKAINDAGLESPFSAEVIGGVPTFAQPSDQSGTVGVAISPLNLSVSDPDGGSLQFSATGLPPGLMINAATGQITGTPTTHGTHSVTVSVFDGTLTLQRTFTWTITAGTTPTTVSAVSSSPNTGSGTVQSFALQYSDSLGAADLKTAAVRFSATAGATASTCYMSYNQAGGTISLLDDAGSSWASASFGNGVLQNSQCSLALASSAATSNGNTLTLNLAVTFKAGYVGAKNIYLYAESAGGANSGWQDRGDWTVPDGFAPALAVTSHSNGQTVAASSITLSGTATDSGTGNSGITSVKVNGTAATSGTATGTGTANWSRTLTLAAGPNAFTVVATDGAGNTKQVALTISYSVADTAAPAVSVTSHSNGQTVTTSSITLSGTATDSGTGSSGIASVVVNGAAASGGTATGSGTASWSKTLALAAGGNAITVVATDGAGNTKEVALTITYAAPDTAAPAVAVASHSNGQTVSASSITLSGTATDSGAGNSGITSVTVNGAAASGGTASGSSTANWTRTLTLTTGANTITVMATDGAGNTQQTTLTISYAAADAAAPAVSVTGPSNGQTVNTASITVSGTATDSGTGNSGIASVTVNGTAAAGGTVTGSGTAQWSRTLTLAGGANTITVVATDGAGNTKQVALTITYAAPDTAPPGLVVTSHANGETVATATGSITLSGSASDAGLGDSGVAMVTVNGAAATGGTATGAGQAVWSRVVSLAPGANVLSVVAADGAGNARQTQLTVNFTLQPPAPSALQGHWVFNEGTGVETVNALAPTSDPGILTAGAEWTAGRFGSAVSLDGVDDHVLMPNVETAGNQLTIAAWVRNRAFTNRDQRIISKASDGTLWGTDWMLGAFVNSLGQRRLRFRVNAGGATATLASTSGDLPLDAWYHVAATYDGTRMRLYLNGQLVGSVSKSGALATRTLPITVGRTPNGGDYLSGALDDLRVYTTALTPEEISELMTGIGATVSPASGAGSSQLFTVDYASSAGPAGLASAGLRFETPGSSGANSCTITYEVGTGTVMLLNDAGTSWLTAPSGWLQNSQCGIDIAASRATLGVTSVNVALAVRFTAAFTGTKNLSTSMTTAGGANTGWQPRGTWTVP